MAVRKDTGNVDEQAFAGPWRWCRISKHWRGHQRRPNDTGQHPRQLHGFRRFIDKREFGDWFVQLFESRESVSPRGIYRNCPEVGALWIKIKAASLIVSRYVED